MHGILVGGGRFASVASGTAREIRACLWSVYVKINETRAHESSFLQLTPHESKNVSGRGS